MGFEPTTLVVIGTECIGSCKSNYHIQSQPQRYLENSMLYEDLLYLLKKGTPVLIKKQHILHGKLDIFPLMCAADKVWITKLTLIHQNIRTVRNSHVQELTLILKIVGQCDVKHILTSLIKTITAVTYIITSISAHPVRLAAILVIMSVSTFIYLIMIHLKQDSNIFFRFKVRIF